MVASVDRYVLNRERTSLFLFSNRLSVEAIRQYDANGRTFCYVLDTVLLAADGQGRGTQRPGASTSLFFFDEDGDGVFGPSEHGWGRDPRQETPTIPEWAHSR